LGESEYIAWVGMEPTDGPVPASCSLAPTCARWDCQDLVEWSLVPRDGSVPPHRPIARPMPTQVVQLLPPNSVRGMEKE
jgi:hypothetical protein